MDVSIAKLVDLKRKKWQSKQLQDTKSNMRQVLNKCVAKFNKVLSYRKKQERSPRCSETTVVSLVEFPDDIVEEILHRLPVENLVRWKSVSKGWKSLIESSHLAEKHLRFNKKKYGDEALKISIESCSRSDFSIMYFKKRERLIGNHKEYREALLPRVPGSCNGLVCVYDLIDVYIINPITRVIRTLSHPLGRDYYYCKASSVGFGRDIVSGRYKVVVLYSSFDNDKIVKAKVFDLSSNEWRSVVVDSCINTLNLLRPITNPVFVNGSLFWLFYSEILVMDLHTEKFSHISLPPNISLDFGYLWSLEDRLYAGEYISDLGVFNVWVLVQDVWDKTIYDSMETVTPPLLLNYAWFLPSLVSPYQ